MRQTFQAPLQTPRARARQRQRHAPPIPHRRWWLRIHLLGKYIGPKDPSLPLDFLSFNDQKKKNEIMDGVDAFLKRQAQLEEVGAHYLSHLKPS